MARIKEWEELTICDNFLFQKVMQNKRLCKRLIQKLLKIKIKNIIYPVAEKSIAIGATSKSIRLDLYVETDDGTIIDIEIQTTDGADGWLPKRTRYYQAMIDLDVLGKGKDYIELKKSYVIFICTFDPFDSGEKVYTFSNRCHERDYLELGDETTKLFLNAKGTKGKADKDIESFLAYVDGNAAEGKFTQDIAAEVERVKQHNETKVEYMTLMMELKQQRREGYAEGQDSERLNSIRNLMESLHWTAQQAMDALKIPASEQSKYAAQL
ncbi:Rpn family recombination-promoting nuclease/putative transposase [Selenomonas sp. AB3002]|uniref:Rpn family recombination-promoting nuclease/putative transposase n=1 Tax=Selenomonas sp. AB3002 TaxID=1392502 RepID=UPI00049783DA